MAFPNTIIPYHQRQLVHSGVVILRADPRLHVVRISHRFRSLRARYSFHHSNPDWEGWTSPARAVCLEVGSGRTLNVTVAPGGRPDAGGGFVTVYPCDGRPDASNLNFTDGQVIANSVIAPASVNGDVCFAAHLPHDEDPIGVQNAEDDYLAARGMDELVEPDDDTVGSRARER